MTTFQKSLSNKFSFLAVLSFALGGVMSVILVLSRALPREKYPQMHDMFETSLVVHVDLTVLSWLIGGGAAIAANQLMRNFEPFNQGSFWLMLLGSLVLFISPFLAAGDTFLTNYVLVMTTPLFFLGLGTIFIGFALFVVNHLLNGKIGGASDFDEAISFGAYFALFPALMAIIAFAISANHLSDSQRNFDYYEHLFWASGHIIQFMHTQFMMICWAVLARHAGYATVNSKLLCILFAANSLFGSAGVIGLFINPFADGDYLQFFTTHMNLFGGIAPMLFLFAMLHKIFTGEKNGNNFPAKAFLYSSIMLFLIGGLIALRIEGYTLITPSHYHASIVSISIAFMGYLALQKGILSGRWISASAILYAVGQLIHVLSFWWLGEQGVARKSAGAAEDVLFGAFAYSLTKTGGLLAMIGALIFICKFFIGSRKSQS